MAKRITLKARYQIDIAKKKTTIVMKLLMNKQDASEIAGIIFPFFPEHAQRLLNEGKSIFAKFFGKERVPLKLREGSRLFLYESGGSKEIVGEAKIAKLESMCASKVISVYGEKLFLNEAEFEDYVGTRGDRSMLILVLVGPKRYLFPLKLDKSVTMAGRYMTREMFVRLRKESKESRKTEGLL
jgi:hypothetical protein